MKFSIKEFFSKWKTLFFVQCAKLTWIRENQFNLYITQIQVYILLPVYCFTATLFCCHRFIFSPSFIMLLPFYFFTHFSFLLPLYFVATTLFTLLFFSFIFFSILFFIVAALFFHVTVVFCFRFILLSRLYFFVDVLLFLFLNALFGCYCFIFSRHFSFLSLFYLFVRTETAKEIQNDKEKEMARN